MVQLADKIKQWDTATSVLHLKTEEFMLVENLLTSNIFADSSSTSQATPKEKEKKNQGNISLGETEWKIWEDTLKKDLSYLLPVSLREESHSLMTPICFYFPERKDGAKQGWRKMEIDWVAMVSETYSNPNPRNIILYTQVITLTIYFHPMISLFPLKGNRLCYYNWSLL